MNQHSSTWIIIVESHESVLTLSMELISKFAKILEEEEMVRTDGTAGQLFLCLFGI